MRVPLSWLREYAQLPGVTGREAAERLIAAGLEAETVDQVGGDVTGVVVGEVLEIEELTGFKKPIRYCQVRVSPEGEPRGIICGAVNFAAGDRVPVALPGAVLPGGFKIAARKSYGHVSDGMICSVSELGIGDDHSGILVLAGDAPVGADFVEYAGLRDEVLDIAVTPDRGYCLSVRGVAREAATAFGAEFSDPAEPADVAEVDDAPGPDVQPASIADPEACDRFVLREVRGFDPGAPTPLWMRVRLLRAGMRPVSLAVDITNYLMLELGQPLHAFDKAKLSGPIVVRQARPGERLETLDHVERELDPGDILITDSSGPISMAGAIGGLSTEIDDASTDLVIEAAHFPASGIARMIRRHRLSSEASYRFERGVDRELPLAASARAARLLASLGGATIVPGCTHAEVDVPPVTITMAPSHPDHVAGVGYGREVVERRLRDVGCEARPAPGADGEMLEVTPPSWRPDLTAPNDLAEEVIRLEGYENIPVRLPRAPAGRGLTPVQRTSRTAGRALASAGYAEVLSPPFISERDFDALQLPPDDPQRRALRLVNPVSEDEPLLRTTLLPGLLRTVVRNIGRGFPDLALYEMGLVYLPKAGPAGNGAAPAAGGERPGNGAALRAPRLRVDRAPTEREREELEAALPHQPLRAAAVVSGDWEPAGWWGPGRPAGWADAVEVARTLAGEVRVPVTVRAGQAMPWHPGRCAEILVSGDGAGERLVGHAGELHPRVVQAFGLPPRTCAMEIDLSVIEPLAGGPVPAPRVSPYPVATQDVALVVEELVPAADVAGALRAGAGELLEEIRLFDVYTGAQAGEGRKSLAYRLRFRAPDRTLTAEEITAARDAAVAEASRRTGAVLRAG
jgi:phenylalanyl-tRNA synthetase beta chain